jgi:indole-3-glycerol phosphate synthase
MKERRADAEAARRRVPLRALEEAAAARPNRLSLAAALAEGVAPRVIAEVKKASPSAGLLQPEYRPERTAGLYAAAGACAISVLTEPRHFLGAEDHLRAVRAAVNLPVLRKDFLGDPYQAAEAAAWGADAILLIMAALGRGQARELHAAAREYGLDVLAEAHTAPEVDAALELPGAIVGVNSRDLKTLKIDLGVAVTLGVAIPADRIAVAESGIRSRSDVERLLAAGYRGFLIGESLLRERDPAAKLRELMGAPGDGAADNAHDKE